MIPESLARLLVGGLQIYLICGLLFAIPFLLRGVGRVDPAARAGTPGFRLLILPGTIALWPLLALRWRRGGPPPEERNAHRDAARAREGSGVAGERP